MGKGIITREEINNLKRKRKRKLRLMTISVISLMFVSVMFFVVLFNNIKDTKLKGRTINVGVSPDLGYREGNDLVATPGDPQRRTYYYDYAEREDASFEYDLPETELPDVASITGNDYVNDQIFGKNPSEPIALQYFEDAVFIGDSRTEGLVLYSDLVNINSFSYKGLNVSKLEDEPCINVPDVGDNLTCYQAVSSKVYDYYYLMFGINELGWPSPDGFVSDFSKLIDHIYAVNPNAVIYVQSIISISKEKSASDDVFNKEKVDEFNAALLEMCRQRGDVIFLDINSVVTDEEGYLPAEGTFDGIHLYGKYCKRVIQYIRSNTYYRK